MSFAMVMSNEDKNLCQRVVMMKHFVIAALLCLGVLDINAQSMTENALTQEYLTNLKISGYNKDIMPEGNHGYGSPVGVLCSMYLLDISKVDDVNMDFRGTFYFRQSWNDSRLAYTDQDINTIIFNDPLQKIWTPDLFFVQERQGIHHNLISPNAFILISPEGEVRYSVRVSVTFSCPMDFRKYPHDKQKCTFTVESYGHTRDKMELNWDRRKHQPIMYNEKIEMLPFELKGVEEKVSHLTFSFGEYTTLEVSLFFERKVGFYVTRLYIPFIFLVVISWLSFWIPSRMLTVRLSLLLVILYLMVNIGSGINDSIPPASYTKGSDVWIAVCESLVFLAFLEYIAVYILARNTEKWQKNVCKNDPEARGVLEPDDKMNSVKNDLSNSAVMMASRLKSNILASKRIDKASAALFPVLFLVFNFVYWIVYCTGH
ncbi:glycine receptor subunit alpha-2 [Caerostris darwini]|uniref:Glycine receptor subunit alpha-2 n=1 Tax=Caerostris darwini TaxID=1538125 RepID=A0AAV4VT41_9ARAC|nr:glycine receptor subunit alpha-2 [Caerostris darwini]